MWSGARWASRSGPSASDSPAGRCGWSSNRSAGPIPALDGHATLHIHAGVHPARFSTFGDYRDGFVDKVVDGGPRAS
jgi:hypothetical protein